MIKIDWDAWKLAVARAAADEQDVTPPPATASVTARESIVGRFTSTKLSCTVRLSPPRWYVPNDVTAEFWLACSECTTAEWRKYPDAWLCPVCRQSPERVAARLERKREMTRERVRRWRARQGEQA